MRSTLRAFQAIPVLFLLTAGCMHSSSSSSDTSSAGSRFEDDENGDRETVLITPRDEPDAAYDVRQAIIDTAMIRVADYEAAGALVEVLVKGYFPDGCFELNELDQEPVRGGQNVILSMRRPSEAICTQVVRPYRFFFTLDRRLDPGRYVLTVNGQPFSFEVGARG